MKNLFISFLSFFFIVSSIFGQNIECDFLNILGQNTYSFQYYDSEMHLKSLSLPTEGNKLTKQPERVYNAYAEPIDRIIKHLPHLCFFQETSAENWSCAGMKEPLGTSDIKYLVIDYTRSYKYKILEREVLSFNGLEIESLPQKASYLSINNYNMPLDRIIAKSSARIINLTRNSDVDFIPIINTRYAELVFLDTGCINSPEIALSSYLNNGIEFYSNSYYLKYSYMQQYGNNLSQGLAKMYDFDYQIACYIKKFYPSRKGQMDSILSKKTLNFNSKGGEMEILNEFEVWELMNFKEAYYRKTFNTFDFKRIKTKDSIQKLLVSDTLGSKVLECQVLKNTLHGPLTIFHSNGSVRERRFYDMGIPSDCWMKYDSVGRNMVKVDYGKRIKYSFFEYFNNEKDSQFNEYTFRQIKK